ncbi:hypothetical protein SVIOM342S_10420 [Streptomyces violaceorubidus]
MTYELSETPEAEPGTSASARPLHRLRWNKAPEVTAYFWIIKVLCTTVGETAADLLNEKAGLGLTGVSLLMSALLAVVLVIQFRTKAYRAGVYWLGVALISVVGTLISDNLTDNIGVPLETTTAVFAVPLAVAFVVVWYRREHTFHSQHRHHQPRGVLLAGRTFHLRPGNSGRRSGLRAHGPGLLARCGPLRPGHRRRGDRALRLGLDAVWSFWIAYILTRPLGASIGDYLSQPTGDGGLRVRHRRHQRALPGRHPRPGGVPGREPQGRRGTRARDAAGGLNSREGVQAAFRLLQAGA